MNQIGRVDISAMFKPARCTWCSHVYDLGKVTVIARYVDCSMWKCPGWKSRKDYHLLDERGQVKTR